MSAKYSIHNLSAGYGDARVLHDVSLELQPSEFAAIIGPNGSGKTTLLRAMSRIPMTCSGGILLDGKDIHTVPAREFARRVAVVPQDTLVAFDFSVMEIVLMGRSPRLGRFAIEGNRDREIALEALTRTGTAHLKDRQINALSGGERQRVLVARALAQEPDVLLLDEPTSHLDISFQFEIMDLVKSLNRERGMTILAVLHDLNLASQYCDRLVMIGQGRVQADGSPDAVITADNIRRVYGAEVWVRRHPATSRPYVIAGVKPGPSLSAKQSTDRPRHVVPDGGERDMLSSTTVHVIGGGGTAAPVLAKLIRRGYSLTCGVLNEGDADQEVAEALDIPHISQPVFAGIAPDSLEKHRELMRAADVVVLTDVPVGHGNLPNVEVALEAARAGKPIIALKPELIGSRDFTDGRATALLQELMSFNVKSAATVDEVARGVENVCEAKDQHSV